MVTVLVVLMSCITIRNVTKELNTIECTLDLYDISGRWRHKSDQYSKALLTWFQIRSPQDVDVLAVLEFGIPCPRPENPGLHHRPLLLKYEGYGEN